MCLAVPAKVVQRGDDETATVDLHGNRVQVNTMLAPDAAVGDWVLIHAGLVIEKLDEAEAAATWAVLDDFAQHRGADENETAHD